MIQWDAFKEADVSRQSASAGLVVLCRISRSPHPPMGTVFPRANTLPLPRFEIPVALYRSTFTHGSTYNFVVVFISNELVP